MRKFLAQTSHAVHVVMGLSRTQGRIDHTEFVGLLTPIFELTKTFWNKGWFTHTHIHAFINAFITCHWTGWRDVMDWSALPRLRFPIEHYWKVIQKWFQDSRRPNVESMAGILSANRFQLSICKEQSFHM